MHYTRPERDKSRSCFHAGLAVQGIAAESRAKLARLKEAWKEKAVIDKAVERGDVSKIKKKKVPPAS